MSISVRVLVPAKDFKSALDKIKIGESFYASLNNGGYPASQFITLLINLDEYDITDVVLDKLDVTAKTDGTTCRDCIVRPIIRRINNDTERNLEPGL